MKAHREIGSRSIHLTEIPTDFGDAETRKVAAALGELTIDIKYAGPASGQKAIILDNIILPLIVHGLTGEDLGIKRVLATWTAKYETVCNPGEEEDIDPGTDYVEDTFDILSTETVGDQVKVRWQATFKTVVELGIEDLNEQHWDIEPGPGYVDDFEVLNTERLP